MTPDSWDVFCEYGLRRPIQGFSDLADTGNHPPICFNPPRYVPHESEVMQILVEWLYEHGVVEEDYGPWGALVVLAEKPHQ